MESSESLRSASHSALTGAVSRLASIATIVAGMALSGWPVKASSAGVDADARDALAHIVEGEIAAGRIPGAVIVAGNANGVTYREAFGFRALVPAREPMTLDTEFDLASLTKVIATTTAIMQLVEVRRLELDAPVSRYWPAFSANGKQAVTVRELLAHTSGLAPDLPLSARTKGRAGVLRETIAQRLRAQPGERVIYSDINFVVLGELVRRVTHQSLDDYCRVHIFDPLRMRDTMFKPELDRAARAAATTADALGMRVGRVHDPTATRMGGVSGNAGLFSTADDLARFAQMMLHGGKLDSARIVTPGTIESMAARASEPRMEPWRGLGWAVDAPLAANRDRIVPIGSIYHTGYTGTALWIDLVSKRFVIILTNRVHPDDSGDARPLRAQVIAWFSSGGAPVSADDISRALPSVDPVLAEASRLPRSTGPVATGIDALEALAFAPFDGMRVGLVTNRSGFDSAGRRTIDLLAHSSRVTLAGIFAPEHGIDTNVDERLDDTRDTATGIVVHSLYGKTRRFTEASLDGLDALVIDLQDAGVRFFTYETTLGYALEAAAARHIPLFVLDRPDPLGADRFGGPVLDAEKRSFTGYFPLPLEPGMTMGELAALFNDERRIGADLRVIRLQGYSRSMRFADTGLGWVPPSPNLRTLAQLDLYPDIALVEGANVSVGRGTAHPFEWIGAPWIDGARLADALNALPLGARFAPIDFVPTESSYHGIQCHGVSIVRGSGPPRIARLGLALLMTLHALYADRFDFNATRDAVGSDAVWQAIHDGADIATIEAIEARQRDGFTAVRERHLLY